MSYRIEKDTMGEVNVPSARYWGAHARTALSVPVGTKRLLQTEDKVTTRVPMKAGSHAGFHGDSPG